MGLGPLATRWQDVPHPSLGQASRPQALDRTHRHFVGALSDLLRQSHHRAEPPRDVSGSPGMPDTLSLQLDVPGRNRRLRSEGQEPLLPRLQQVLWMPLPMWQSKLLRLAHWQRVMHVETRAGQLPSVVVWL